MAIQQLTGALMESWKLQHFQAMNVRLLEDACAVLQRFVDKCDEAWKATAAQLLSGELKNPEADGQQLRAVLQEFEKQFPWIEAGIAEAKRNGYDVKKAEEQLERTKQQIQSRRAKLEAKWPFIDRKAVAESRAQIERGECHPIEDLLSEPERRANAEILRKAM